MMKKMRERGAILPTALILLVVFTMIGVTFLELVSFQFKLTRESAPRASSVLVAEAGVEKAVLLLNQDDEYTGGTQTFFDNVTQGRGVFTAAVEEMNDSNARTIVSTGTIYRYGTDEVLGKRTVRVVVVGTSSEGYSVATGPGGLILGGSAAITNSNVAVNGYITMTGAARIGTSAYPVNVDVANIACPTGNTPGPTYPTLCTSTQPISLQYSTFIYGTVCATGQTSYGPNPSHNILPGAGGEGLKIGCVAPSVSPPSYDRAVQIAAVTTTKPSSDPDINCNTWRTGIEFRRTWPANIKITGNMPVDSSCDVTVTGNVYITGNLTLGGAAKIRVADSLGATQPVILVDGTIDVGGSSQVITNSSGTGVKFISFKGSGSCNLAASCSGTDLKTSQGVLTVNIRGGVNMPGNVFQSYWGKIKIAGSGNIGAAAGQTVDMDGAGTVTFGTELSSGERSWTISSYQRVYE